jgi:hypothetical protein
MQAHGRGEHEGAHVNPSATHQGENSMTTAVNETRENSENSETGENLRAAAWSDAERQRNEEWMAWRFAQEDR